MSKRCECREGERAGDRRERQTVRQTGRKRVIERERAWGKIDIQM